MNNKSQTIKLNKWKLIGSTTIDKVKMRYEEDVFNDLKKMEMTHLKVAEHRRAWKWIVENTKTFTFEIVVP